MAGPKEVLGAGMGNVRNIADVVDDLVFDGGGKQLGRRALPNNTAAANSAFVHDGLDDHEQRIARLEAEMQNDMRVRKLEEWRIEREIRSNAEALRKTMIREAEWEDVAQDERPRSKDCAEIAIRLRRMYIDADTHSKRELIRLALFGSCSRELYESGELNRFVGLIESDEVTFGDAQFLRKLEKNGESVEAVVDSKDHAHGLALLHAGGSAIELVHMTKSRQDSGDKAYASGATDLTEGKVAFRIAYKGRLFVQLIKERPAEPGR